MIFIEDKRVKVGGSYLPGTVKSIRVVEEGKLEDKKKGKKKLSNQPTGYEPANVEIDLLLEETSTSSLDNMIQLIQRLFKTAGQKKQKKYRITVPEVNSHGIYEAYLNGISTTKEEAQSWASCTLTFVAPTIAGLTVTTTKTTGKKATGNSKKKTSKDTSKSPAGQKSNNTAAKKNAKKLVKK